MSWKRRAPRRGRQGAPRGNRPQRIARADDRYFRRALVARLARAAWLGQLSMRGSCLRAATEPCRGAQGGMVLAGGGKGGWPSDTLAELFAVSTSQREGAATDVNSRSVDYFVRTVGLIHEASIWGFDWAREGAPATFQGGNLELRRVRSGVRLTVLAAKPRKASQGTLTNPRDERLCLGAEFPLRSCAHSRRLGVGLFFFSASGFLVMDSDFRHRSTQRSVCLRRHAYF